MKPAGALAMLAAVSCSAASPAPALPPGREGIEQWRAARAEVRALRERFRPQRPYSMNVMLDLEQPQLGKRMRARGAVAVRPPDALRMILLGPGGTTALDLWVCRDAFRFAVPAVDLERRGDRRTPSAETRGLPVEFLSWWFLRPFAGTLQAFSDADPRGRRYVLREGEQIVHLLDATASSPPALEVRRLSDRDEERLDVDGRRCGRVRYRQQLTGLDIEVHCEGLNEAPPSPRAFADPDDPERGCAGERP